MKNWLKIIFSILFLFSFVITICILLIWIFHINLYIIALIIGIIDFFISLLIFFSQRRSEVKLSWIIFIIFIPFIGFWSYIFFGRKYFYNKRKDEHFHKINKQEYLIYQNINFNNLKIIQKKSPNLIKVFKLMNNKYFKPIYSNNKINIFFNGTIAFQKILDDIQLAKKYILFNYFIISDGELFEIFLEIIHKKINEGIKIYLIYDYVGSYFKISKKSINKLNKIGVYIKKYLPIIIPFLNRKANYRNHRKDIIIDGKIAYTGGMNLDDLYINKSPKFGWFHDVQVRIEGESVYSIELIFINDWNFVNKNHKNIIKLIPEIVKHKTFDIKNNILVQIINNNPCFSHSINEELFLLLINGAKKRIWLSTPYFIPPNELILALKLAAKVGIDVRLTIPGLTDKIFILDLTKLYCKELIDAGVKIYEMNNIFNHSKIAIVDNDVAIVSTCNLDYRSFFSDYQTTVMIYNKNIVKSFEKRWLWDYDHAILWKEWPIQFKPIKYRLFLSCLKIFSPIL